MEVNKMKRILAFALVIACILSLVGCSGFNLLGIKTKAPAPVLYLYQTRSCIWL